ncbi:alkaline-phosphatase-like protein [Lipomyces kononenkoae]|uniref:Alkaline-phosphatase-like protein n=1 Tax=Lipomyces kononenkoae TaxID=34357 RepID=A0ACC3T9G0_LIPKO
MKLTRTSIFLAATAMPMIRAVKPNNYVFFLPDGYGPASETFARDYANYVDESTIKLPVDNLAIGYVRTKSLDSLVTDSAAAATAYACGIKTNNRAIGVDGDNIPCGTVLEAAKLDGYLTGLVVTSRITHASPAGFAAHVADRDMESEIAEQIVGYSHPLGRVVDVMMGGGKCFFLPKSNTDSCRDDDLDLWSIAEDVYHWTMTSSRAAFDSASDSDAVDIPFAFIPASGHMAYEVDRDPQLEPSLTDMAITALDILHRKAKEQDTGFFLFIEASRIDHGGHAHDPIAHLYDILEYNRAMLAVKRWVDDNDDTVLLSAADHECGGLTLGVPDYAWYPSVLTHADHSAQYYAAIYKNMRSFNYSAAMMESTLVDRVFGGYGIYNVTLAEIAGLAITNTPAVFLGELLSSRAGINWSTLGHTAVDVTLFGHGLHTEKLVGNHDNTDVCHFMADQLGLDLGKATRRLQSDESFVASIRSAANAKKFLRPFQHEHEDDIIQAHHKH